MKTNETTQPKLPVYLDLVKPEIIEKAYDAIVNVIYLQKKYRDPDYSVKKFSAETGLSLRDISAVINRRFHTNYSQLVNELRINEARYLLQDSHFTELSIEEIAEKVGFTTRQSFHVVFMANTGMTPKQYRMRNTIKREPKKAKTAKKNAEA